MEIWCYPIIMNTIGHTYRSLYLQQKTHTLTIGTLLLLILNGLASASPQRDLEFIVTIDWLKTQLDNKTPNLRLIDVRYESDYTNGHIPGAVNFPVELSFQHNRIVSIRRIRTLLRNLGIHNSDRLVIYDDGHLRDAAHVFWMLETYGHEDIVVLDGGLPAWKKADLAISYSNVKYPVSNYVPTITPLHLTTKLGTRLALKNPNVTIIDSRLESEFRGEESKASRTGHIPNSVNINAGNSIDKSQGISKLKPVAQLKKLYRDIDKSSEVITYCNRGKDSALNYLIMRSLGYKSSVYDGGWLEWGNDYQLPIEK